MKVVLIEDEINLHELIKEGCAVLGHEVVLVITPLPHSSAEAIARAVQETMCDLILLDHDFCSCNMRGRCECLNGQEIFECLGASSREKVMSISGITRKYLPADRGFAFKDCLDEAGAIRCLGIKIERMFEET